MIMEEKLESKMKVAILGAGFSGLAATWHLLKKTSCQVTLFDPVAIGGGTSGIAAGLMHPYAGAHAKRNWLGLEGCAATMELLQVATDALGAPVASYSGLLRMAFTAAQQADYALCANRYCDVAWWKEEDCLAKIPAVAPAAGLWIPTAVTVYSSLYLQGLWRACQQLGACLEQKAISTLEELHGFDKIIVAMGAATCSLPELRHLPITPVKGQILDLLWPTTAAPLPCALNSHAYLAMNREGFSCLAGATFEKEFSSASPEVDVAMREILPKAIALVPELAKASVLACRAGIRASTPDHRPIVLRLNPRCWVLTGMGSKGLLYHALLAKQLIYSGTF
jgi:glycine/D-amino acid oxidase-like deaminating enzyme